jgi:hypothetical protein
VGFDSPRISHPQGAQLQFDPSPADWILGRLLPWGRELGTRVCAVVPSGYEAYVRVFHHAEERVGADWVRRRWSEVAQWTGRQMHPTVQFERFSWSDGPQEGSLDRDEATSLVAILRHQTATPEDCWLAIWHGYGELSGGVGLLVLEERGFRDWLRRRRARDCHRLEPPADLVDAPTLSLPAREYYLYRAPIDVVPRFEFLPGRLQTPNMWWPDDRAWFVGTEIDFDSTLVACTRSCAATLLASDLEVLEISPDSRLDIDGDTVNVRASDPAS